MDILKIKQEVWIDNLGILEAKQDILDKKWHKIAPKLDRLDEKAWQKRRGSSLIAK